MSACVSRADETRRTETPNAVMTTLASPTQGGAAHSIWRVSMQPGGSGPDHSFDREQVWLVVEGSATVVVDREEIELDSGDTVVIPAGTERRIEAGLESGLEAIVSGDGESRASIPGGEDRGVPPWIG